MALPGNLTTITVTGKYVDMVGTAIAGQVKFTPRAVLKNATADTILIPITITKTLDANGAFSQVLVATDDADATPSGFTYEFEEAFIGGRTFDFLLPSNTPAGTIDIADIAAAVVNDGTATAYASFADYVTLEGRVTVVEGLVNTASAFFATLTTELTAAIAGSSAAVALINSYIGVVGQITDNGAGVNPLLFPAKVS